MSRPLQATIDLAALRNNLGVARRHAGAAKVWAVIKANGYGHGMLRVARALAEADGYAVLNLGEASALRHAGVRKPILLLEGLFHAEELPQAAALDVSCVVHEEHQVRALLAGGLPKPVGVFLKINSGMNRLGFAPGAVEEVVAGLRACPSVAAITLMTHFATADEAAGIVTQLACFQHATAALALPRSLANSAALLRYPEARGEWVRPGIMLYGASPFAEVSAAALGLQPAMTLASEVIAVQELKAGDRVGYGGLFEADRPMRVGTVACGYADGYPRHAVTGTPVLVGGRRSRLLGRVSMDMLSVDLTPCPEAQVGTPVVLWGRGLPVEEVAAAAGTISYELLCAVAPRVPMVEA